MTSFRRVEITNYFFICLGERVATGVSAWTVVIVMNVFVTLMGEKLPTDIEPQMPQMYGKLIPTCFSLLCIANVGKDTR